MGRSRTWSEIGQRGAFSSTTTVTGLPSTPARNTRRHPQARRAWVNPLSMTLILLQQALDIRFVLRLADQAGILPADPPVARNHEGRRDAPHRTVCILQVIAVEADEHR